MQIVYNKVHLDVIRNGYKATWLKKSPRQKIPPYLLKPLWYLTPKFKDISRKEQSERLARYKDNILIHILQYLNLREFLTSGDIS